MKKIENEFKIIANKIEEMHSETNEQRTFGAIAAGVGIIGLALAPFTGGLSLAAVAGSAKICSDQNTLNPSQFEKGPGKGRATF